MTTRTIKFVSAKRAALAAMACAGAIAALTYGSVHLKPLFGEYPDKAEYSRLQTGIDSIRAQSQRALSGSRAAGKLAAARAVEAAIQSSRASARRTGTKPIPPDMRERLEEYFPDEILDQVRWAYPNRYLDLGSLAAWYQNEGSAITLKDTIVYSNEVGVRSELLWAHELTHVLQYDELGLRGFSRAYTTDLALLEQQASENALRIVRDIRAKRRAQAKQSRSKT